MKDHMIRIQSKYEAQLKVSNDDVKTLTGLLNLEREGTGKLSKQLEILSKESKKKDEIMAKRSDDISVLKKKLEDAIWENEWWKLESKASDY